MKYENTRIVTFQEDYYVKTRQKDKDGNNAVKLLHKKGSRHAMHKGIVKILEANKAKIKVEEFDPKPLESKLKKRLIEQRKRQADLYTQ